MAEGFPFPWWLLIPYYCALAALWLTFDRRRVVFALGCGLLLAFAGFCQLSLIPYRAARQSGILFPEATHAVVAAVHDGKTLYLVTDAEGVTAEKLRENLSVRFSRYITDNCIDSVALVKDVNLHGVLYADEVCWSFGGITVGLIGEQDTISGRFPSKPDILLVTRRFKGDIVEICKHNPGAAVVISPAVYDYRRKRFEEELRSAGIPFTDSFREVPSLSGSMPTGN